MFALILLLALSDVAACVLLTTSTIASMSKISYYTKLLTMSTQKVLPASDTCFKLDPVGHVFFELEDSLPYPKSVVKQKKTMA